jgi:hypothetical protein
LEEGAAAVAALDHGAAAQLGALGGFLLRTESVATSKIERIAVDLDDFARALAGHVAGDDARLTAAAVHAIAGLVGSAGAGPITVEALHEAHRALLADDRFEATYAGGPRPMQNWVGGNDFTPRLATTSRRQPIWSARSWTTWWSLRTGGTFPPSHSQPSCTRSSSRSIRTRTATGAWVARSSTRCCAVVV